MRKSLLTVPVLLAASLVAAQTAPQSQAPPAGAQPGQSATQPGQSAAQPGQPPAQPGQGQAAAPAQQKKEIKDPAEYNAYMAAVQATDPNQKAAALEGFLNQYPNSVMKSDAIEMLMATYQQTGNVQKVQDTATRLLQADPNNTAALAVMAYLKRAAAEQGGPDVQANSQQAQQYAQQGLQALQSQRPPEGVSQADFEKRQAQLKSIFNGVLGFAALQQKNYPQAAQYLQENLQANPNDLQTTYQLAVAMLEQSPPNPQGLFYVARAAALAGPQQQPAIVKYGRAKYVKYHGGDDGWDQLLAEAKNSPTPPANFQIAPAPTPAEQAGKLVQSKQVKDMSFDEIQLVLTSGNQQAADQVWNQIKDKPIALLGTLITGSPETLQVAGSYEDIQAKKPDIELKMVAPIPAKIMPTVGGDVKFQGVPVSYDPSPFMVHMEKGTLIGAPKATPAPAKKAPATRRRTPPRH